MARHVNERFIAVRVDITRGGNPDEHLLEDTFVSGALPVVAIVDGAGTYLPDKTIGVGVPPENLTADQYLEILESVR